VHHADAKSLASILAWCNHVAPGDALLLEHDLVAPVVDRDAGEDPCGHDTGDAAGCAAQA